MVYCEIAPYSSAMEKIESINPVGIILSGGPDSVCRPGSPALPPEFFTTGIPTLGICYGLQLIIQSLGGKVVPGNQREFGKAMVEKLAQDALLSELPSPFQVWMSHGDRIEELAPGFQVLARSGDIVSAVADPKRNMWGLQFHPESVITDHGRRMLWNWVSY